MGFWKKTLAGLAVLGMIGVASAQGKLRIGMENWIGYTAEMDSDAKDTFTGGEAGFVVNRALAYLNYYYNDEWSVHGGYDISNGTDNATTSTVDGALFHAYLQGKFHGQKVQFGRHHNWYVKEMDKATGTRWISESVAEGSGAVNRSGDGISVGGEVADMVHWDVSLVNGARGAATTGESAMDIGFHVGASFSEMFGVHLNVRSTTSDITSAAQTSGTMTLGGGVSFSHDMVDVLAEVYSSEDQEDAAADALMVFGATANFKFMDGDAGFYAQFASWDYDSGVANARHIGGATVGATGNIIGDARFESFIKVGPWYNDSENGYKIGLFYSIAGAEGTVFNPTVHTGPAIEDVSMLEINLASRF